MTKQARNGAAALPLYRVLVADDSAFARGNAALLVTRLGGVIVGEAVNGREAVEQYQRLRPDLVLLDVTMPEMEGIEALQRILRTDPSAAVIMVTALGHQTVLRKALALGAKHFITKPIDYDLAAEIVRAVMAPRASAGS
jgi:two-component system chemotaxis response regulator CheY